MCYIKILCDLSKDEKVIGLHVMCPNANEMVQGFALAMKAGAKKS